MKYYLIGHRGFGMNSYNLDDPSYMENTEYAILKAYHEGITVVEIDIHMLDNKDIVVSHDLPKKNITYPLLEEILINCNFINFNIEIKTDGQPDIKLLVEKLSQMKKIYQNIKFFSTFNFKVFQEFGSKNCYLLICKDNLKYHKENLELKIICDFDCRDDVEKKSVVGFYGENIDFQNLNQFENLEFLIIDRKITSKFS